MWPRAATALSSSSTAGASLEPGEAAPAVLELLIAVEAVGDTRLGAQRWLSIGGFSFQPSEVMKLGIVLALVVGRVFRGLLFGVQPTDPVTLAGAATLFALLALVTCAVPAWRAARVDLMNALRHE